MDEMDAEQRRRLAKAVASKVVGMGSKRAVYKAAGVSAQTLERVLDGESVKPFTVNAIVGALWPSSNGDWRRVYGVYRGEGQAPRTIHSSEDYFEVEIRMLKRRVEAIEAALIRADVGDAIELIRAASDSRPDEMGADGGDAATEEHGEP